MDYNKIKTKGLFLEMFYISKSPNNLNKKSEIINVNKIYNYILTFDYELYVHKNISFFGNQIDIPTLYMYIEKFSFKVFYITKLIFTLALVSFYMYI